MFYVPAKKKDKSLVLQAWKELPKLFILSAILQLNFNSRFLQQKPRKCGEKKWNIKLYAFSEFSGESNTLDRELNSSNLHKTW